MNAGGNDLLEEEMELTMKVIVVGDGRVGKTSLITRFTQGEFSADYKKTLGVDFLQKKMFVKQIAQDVEFFIWDTAG